MKTQERTLAARPGLTGSRSALRLGAPQAVLLSNLLQLLETRDPAGANRALLGLPRRLADTRGRWLQVLKPLEALVRHASAKLVHEFPSETTRSAVMEISMCCAAARATAAGAEHLAWPLGAPPPALGRALLGLPLCALDAPIAIEVLRERTFNKGRCTEAWEAFLAREQGPFDLRRPLVADRETRPAQWLLQHAQRLRTLALQFIDASACSLELEEAGATSPAAAADAA